jgi:hypothetical protein
MIVLKISNASEVVASKVGKFIESLTPDGFDQAKVEDIVIKKLIENLRAEVASVRGVDLDHSQLVLHDRLHVRSQQQF